VVLGFLTALLMLRMIMFLLLLLQTAMRQWSAMHFSAQKEKW
jgi:hypothetical protein